MGRNLPSDPIPRIDWLLVRTPLWVEHAGAIGLPPELAGRARDLAEAASARRAEALAARAAAEAATRAMHAAIEQASAVASAAIAQVKSHAAVTGDPSVLALAAIDPPAPRATRPPPPAPEQPRTRLENGGVVHLSWRGRFGRGTHFEVFRGVDGGPRRLIATAHEKRITDRLPPGCVEAVYHVRAVRPTLDRASAVGPPSPAVCMRLGATEASRTDQDGLPGLAAA